jgi:hypothetical protein
MRTFIVLVLAASLGCRDRSAAPTSETPPVAEEARPELETPAVRGPGLVPAVGLGPKLTISKRELRVDGEVVGHVANGLIDRARLDAAITALEIRANSDAPIAIAVDATIPYRTLAVVLERLKRAGFSQLGLLAGSGSSMIPIQLPAEPLRSGLRPVVELDGPRLVLYSASGDEGSRRQPKLSLPIDDRAGFEPLTRALAEIVRRRWPAGGRTSEDLAIIVMADGAQPTQRLLNVLAAVRADGTLELFPDIFLAGGAR